ncbi:MAG: PAS domain-containing protein, partial [Verrucomicrobiota bacterium]|nr:PAS domain-containing protein [Verrucomicrobiota bacterium]
DDQQVLREGRTILNQDEELTRHDGSKTWILTSKVPLRDTTGRIVGLAGFGLDITERKHAEDQLARLAQDWQRTFDASNDAIWILDAENRIVRSNKTAERLFSCPSDQMIGQFCWAIVHGSSMADPACPLARARSTMQRERNEMQRGNCILEVSVDPLFDQNGNYTGAVHIVSDITERKNAEARLLQSQKLEAIGQLAAGVAHDFNNLLTIVQGNASLLLASLPSDGDAPNLVDQIIHAASRAAALTRQLLAFSRAQHMETRPLNLNETIDSLVKMLNRILGEDINLECHLAPGLPPIVADPNMIEQVIMNLVVNARDAMRKGGRLTIATETLHLDAGTARACPEAREGLFVCLTVKDTGVGIQPEHLPHIFDPFFTTKEIGKGTGLGLATVYGIVKQHRGWIDVSSSAGAGTTLKVCLPAAKHTAHAQTHTETKPRGGTETILLVEDEPAVRKLNRLLLEHGGYRVLEAGSGPEAIELWKSHADEIDLLLTDVVMPGGMTGWELARQLNSEKPTLRIVLTSGYNTTEIDAENSLVQQGNVSLLQKPYLPNMLLQTVRECLDAQAHNPWSHRGAVATE